VLGRPLFGINHHEAHLYSPWIGGEPPRAQFDRFAPNVSLIVSRGHTLPVPGRGQPDHRAPRGPFARPSAGGPCVNPPCGGSSSQAMPWDFMNTMARCMWRMDTQASAGAGG